MEEKKVLQAHYIRSVLLQGSYTNFATGIKLPAHLPSMAFFALEDSPPRCFPGNFPTALFNKSHLLKMAFTVCSSAACLVVDRTNPKIQISCNIICVLARNQTSLPAALTDVARRRCYSREHSSPSGQPSDAAETASFLCPLRTQPVFYMS